MTKIKLWKIIESKSYEDGEEVFHDGDFRLELCLHLGSSLIGNLKMHGCDFKDLNGLIYFDNYKELNEFVKRLFDNDDPLDDLIQS